MLRINPKDITSSTERNTHSLSQNSTALSEVQVISAIFTKKKKKVLTKTGKEASKISLHNALKEGAWSIVQLSVPAFYTEPIDSAQPLLTNAQTINFGLALAGSQTTWKSDSLSKDIKDDGLLTALEIYGLNLSGTDLLVLPHISGGFGTNGHSIYGLLNAFQNVGVKNIIYMLWPLSEQDRLIFFQLFYKNLIKSGSVDQAFSKTQNSLKKKQPDRIWGGIVLTH
jgi:CHAT domain-containing protein